MAVENKLYNPNWEIIHNYHDEQRTITWKEIKECYSIDTHNYDYEKIKEIEKNHEFHHETCLHCLNKLQHKTVQDFAKWLFENFTFPIDKTFIPPYESFKTMKEVTDAWAFLKKKSKDEETQRREELIIKNEKINPPQRVSFVHIQDNSMPAKAINQQNLYSWVKALFCKV